MKQISLNGHYTKEELQYMVENSFPTVWRCKINLYSPCDSSEHGKAYKRGQELFSCGKDYIETKWDFDIPNSTVLICNTGSKIVINGWFSWEYAFELVEG